MYDGKPIIGIAGGIGAGKSYVARLFGEAGCLVLDADAAVRAAYANPEVQNRLRQWWGDDVISPFGAVDRHAIARRVFADAAERKRLEDLLHPYAADDRQRRMRDATGDARVKAFVWDVPLLFETGLNVACDAVVFVDVSVEERIQRVSATRGWSAEELTKRENSQFPLDKKRALSQYVVRNSATDSVRTQVQDVLSRIIARSR